MSTKTEATIENLYRVPDNGKAEIVNGELVLMMPTGFMPGYAGGEIFASLREHSRCAKTGHAMPENTGFIVNPPHRKSFSPDVDLLSDDVVRVYRYDKPDKPTVYRRGQMAEAEPAVPGWKMPVDDLFA